MIAVPPDPLNVVSESVVPCGLGASCSDPDFGVFGFAMIRLLSSLTITTLDG